MVDMLRYIGGDGRIYDMTASWANAGERLQTQVDSNEPRRFFQVKNSNWEEFWWDNQFIWRGTDISPGAGELYQTFTGNTYGMKAYPRNMSVGQIHFTNPRIEFKYKSNGLNVPGKAPYQFPHYIKFVKRHNRYTFTSKDGSQRSLNDVIELASFVDVGGKPAATPFEKYWYARDYGLVQWEDPTKGWLSTIATDVLNVNPPTREVIPWLRFPSLPPLTGTQPQPDPQPEPQPGIQPFELLTKTITVRYNPENTLHKDGLEIIEKSVRLLKELGGDYEF